jgi:hypothetical protein
LVAYDKHPSPHLVRAFKGYQGQEPTAARYIFVGLDANFSPTIEQSPIFPEILQYLSDGVEYWNEKKWHHPFLSPLYNKESGYRYHHEFSKIGLNAEYAEKVSFVEVLNCPTCGKTDDNRFMALIDGNYLKSLDSVMNSSARKKSVFIARGAYSKLFHIGRQFGCFTWLPEPRKFDLNQLYTLDISDTLQVHVITHFSSAISDKHISAINALIVK